MSHKCSVHAVHQSFYVLCVGRATTTTGQVDVCTTGNAQKKLLAAAAEAAAAAVRRRPE